MDIDADDPHGNYNDGNRAFLQAFMNRGQLSFEEGRKILAAIFTVQSRAEVRPAEVTQEDFESYISAAADALSPFDYEIRSTQHQLTKEKIYAVVNSMSDPLTQSATIRTQEEIFYIKRLLDAMFETHNTRRREVMAITSIQAMEKKVLKGVNRPANDDSQSAVDKGLTGGEAEKLLEKLEAEKWLERSKQGFYRLSPRALMELRSWLVEAYNEPIQEGEDADEWQRIKFCEACKEIVTIGQRCAELDCNVRLHNICEAAYWNSRPNKQCPRCETEWDGQHYVGQKAVTTTEEYLKGKRRSGGVKRSRAADDEEVPVAESSNRRSRRASPEPEEEEEEEEEQEKEAEAEAEDDDE
ncbi:hypothetical protein G7Y89_g1121 [Cudoniella acicularis]|uniref:Non-structural maintenance of chromosomes element 1 homolog n=1 Tax=Cudoniella acicularis TaxID=354080 RepID=A0A8H4RXX2_9HELO|nr:hypothetical protein G7Y89_g1121 [Cudoniella acicularis]